MPTDLAGLPAPLRPEQLDELDRRLLTLLAKDGRASFAALGRSTGLSPTAARNRVQRLIETGTVHIVTVPHPAITGLRAACLAMVRTEGAAVDVAQSIADRPDAIFIAATTGRFDVMAELRATSDVALLQALDELRRIEGVRSIESVKYLKIEKAYLHSDGPVHINHDTIDLQLLAHLCEDGRRPLSDLATRVRLSPQAVAARVQRLIDADLLRIVGVTDPMALGIGEICGFTATVDSDSSTVASRIAGMPKVVFVAITSGRYDLIGNISCSSDDDVLMQLDALRAIPGVRSLESHSHLLIAKELYYMPTVGLLGAGALADIEAEGSAAG